MSGAGKANAIMLLLPRRKNISRIPNEVEVTGIEKTLTSERRKQIRDATQAKTIGFWASDTNTFEHK